MVPLTIVVLFTVAILDKVIVDIWGFATGSWERALIHLASNVVIGFATLELLRSRARRQRQTYALEDYGRGAGDDEADAGHDDHDHDHGHDDHAHEGEPESQLAPAH